MKNFEDILTPCYCIDKDKLKNNYLEMETAFKKLWKGRLKFGYSIKTNHFPYFLEYAHSAGFYAEAVSVKEYDLALNCGFAPEEIIFNGPIKTNRLLEAVGGYSLVNLDCLGEVDEIIGNIAAFHNKKIRIGLRINFDLESRCRGETTAGTEVSRFGICIENGDFQKAVEKLRDAGLKVAGLHLHYSTVSRSAGIFEELTGMAVALIDKYNLMEDLQYIDVGGGFFGGRIVSGMPTMEAYAQSIICTLQKIPGIQKIDLILEPGAAVIATAVEYICKVISTKKVRDVRIVTLDGSLMDVNPFMRDREVFYSLQTSRTVACETQIICGSTCMENDRFFKLLNHGEMRMDDIVSIQNAGAYTMCYNNQFIHFPPAVYAVENGVKTLLRKSVEEK